MNPNPLGNDFFRYRKRKQISIDRIPGLEYPRRHSGDTPPASTGHAAQQHYGHDYLGGQDGTEYNLGHAFYSPSSPNYHPVSPWNEMHVPPTPDIRTAPGSFLPGPQPEDPLAAIHALFDPEHRSPTEIADIWRRVLARAAYQNSIEVENLIETVANSLGQPPPSQSLIEQLRESSAPGAEDDGAFCDQSEFPAEPSHSESPDSLDMQIAEMFSASAGVESAADQMSLEDIVDQQWQELDPFAMNDPMKMMDPYDQFPPGPPGMPMDPFGPGM